MRCWSVLLIILLSLCLPVRVQARGSVPAQESIVIQSEQIDIWPEYDRPDVLVIYRITLSPEVKLPAEMTMRIPVTAGAPTAIAEQTANGLFNLAFTETGRDSEWITVSFTTTLPQLQVEYYDSALQKDGDQRSYTFNWPGDYKVDDMLIKVQQPRTASQLTLEPNSGTSSVGQDGLTYFDVPLGQVNAGETFQLVARYQKTDDELTQSAAFEQVTPVNPSNATSTPSAYPEVLPWLLGGLGLVLIGGGVFWYLRGARPAESGQSRPRHRTEPAENPKAEVVFCQQCGKKSAPADLFCRTCGAKLRR
jgi:hypothetical protein